MQSFGSRLFQAVFRDEVEDVLQNSLHEARRLNAGLRVRLHLVDTQELADLPWEFLYDPEMKQPLGLLETNVRAVADSERMTRFADTLAKMRQAN